MPCISFITYMTRDICIFYTYFSHIFFTYVHIIRLPLNLLLVILYIAPCDNTLAKAFSCCYNSA